MSDGRGDSLEQARRVLRGDAAASPEEMLELAEEAIAAQQFGVGRRLLRRARKGGIPPARRTWARQQHALCTYKDPDVPVSARLRKALEILGNGEDLDRTVDQETLGIAGAIFKRRWEATARISDLEQALDYYQRGYEQGIGDDGYTAINAAFALDLLVAAGAPGSEDAGDAPRREAADAIRRGVVERLAEHGEMEPGNVWLQATLAEACVGLARYDEAARWLRRCRESPQLHEWQVESAARQIGALCNMRARDREGRIDPKADEALKAFLGQHHEAVTTAYAGKVGVALSGGGFRASFFHIGVLARLAELDMLRHVEVLSCVSGGSIVGAHYYLEVQRLLESQEESTLTREDYLQLVERLERDFLAAVQKNIRMRVMGNPLANLRALLSSRWTRTREAGRQYERHFYLPIGGRSSGRITMEDLLIQPAGEGEKDPGGRPSFNPRRDNWKRRCKVPILVVNAATLNTGHNWQFTASWMGEPPAVVDEDIDPNSRLRRMYHTEAPRRWRQVSLGEAVAASACVPGLFEPLVMDGLFADVSVQLVDGGVHDNQGVASLIEQECGVMIVSDASGQMTFEASPGRGPMAVPLRSSSVLGARVREAQLRDLLARRSSSGLRSLMLVHLRKSLSEPPRNWIECPEPYEPEDDVRGAPPEGVEIPHSVQSRLANLRTDLDCFSDMEACALMLSGYRMARDSFDDCISGFPTDPPAAGNWRFNDVAAAVDSEGPERSRLIKVLGVGAGRWLKAWALYPALRAAGGLAGVGAFLAFCYLLWQVRSTPILTAGAILGVLVGALLFLGARKALSLRVEPIGGIARIGIGLGLLLCTPLALVQVHLLDRLYRRAGRLP